MLIIISILYFDNNNRSRLINLTADQFTDQKTNSFTLPYEYMGFYITSFKMFVEKPFLGHGPKTYRMICKQEKYNIIHNHASGEDNCSTHPHNTYMQLIGETGFIGTIPLVILFLLITLQLFKTSRNFWISKYDSNLILKHFILVAVFLTLWPLIPSGNFFNNWLSAIYYFPLGILIYIMSNKVNNL